MLRDTWCAVQVISGASSSHLSPSQQPPRPPPSSRMSGGSACNSILSQPTPARIFKFSQLGTGLSCRPSPQMPSTSLSAAVGGCGNQNYQITGVLPPSFCPPSPRSQSTSICADSEPLQHTLWHGPVNVTGDRHGRGVLMWGAGNSCEGECLEGVEEGNLVFRHFARRSVSRLFCQRQKEMAGGRKSS
jgi:hypothetical protein